MKLWEYLPDLILKEQGIKLLKDGKPILLKCNPNGEIANKLNFFMKVRMPYVVHNPYQVEKKERKIIRIESYDELKKSGYVIISIRPRKMWYKGQRKEYRLIKDNEIPNNAFIKSNIPTNHYVELDTIGKVYRLCGKNVRGKMGEWI